MIKEYSFKYGDGVVSLLLEENQVISVLDGNKTKTISNIKEELYSSLDNPFCSDSLRIVAAKAKSIVLVVSDMTRFWMRQDLIVPHIVSYLVDKCNKSLSDIEIIIANGTHKGGSSEDLKKLVTPEVFSSVKVINHNASDDENLVYLGTTSFNTPVYINKDAVEADLVICLGAVTYHVMAGFGGGRKSILPGIAGLETINHNHAYSLDAKSFVSNKRIGNGVLSDNPLNEDMLEAASMMKNLFMINLVTDTEFNLIKIISGHWRKSWEKATEEVRKIYTVEIEKKADVVVTSCGGFPKDESLYQGTKAVDNVISSLKDGGTLILFLEGRNGGGSPDYFSWIKYLKNGKFEEELRSNFTVGGYIFFLNCEQAKRFNILMYSSINPEIVKPMGIKTYSNIDSLLKDANLECKSIYIIPNGSTVLPVVKEEQKCQS